jgi:hypothetical protein
MAIVYRYSLVSILTGALVSGPGIIASSDENPRTVISRLPKIDASKQCNKGECDHTIETEVFTTLERLGDRYLKPGMSKSDVELLFGRPSDRDVDSWKDVRFGNPVTAWLYAISLSGTTAFYVVFVNDRVDYFGPHMISYVLYSYGKPGSSFGDDPSGGWTYRFHGKEPG